MSLALLSALGAMVSHGCGAEDASGPPGVNYGSDLCTECSMILSDERFAAATVIQGPRGPVTLLYDDYNCQINHAGKHPELVVLNRWAHDHGTGAWVESSAAYFVHSERIRSPMASRLAAFASMPGAEAMAAELGGRILSFEAILAGEAASGEPAACCSGDADADGETAACCAGGGGACCGDEPDEKEHNP
jgi:copper chaperone NosL